MSSISGCVKPDFLTCTNWLKLCVSYLRTQESREWVPYLWRSSLSSNTRFLTPLVTLQGRQCREIVTQRSADHFPPLFVSLVSVPPGLRQRFPHIWVLQISATPCPCPRLLHGDEQNVINERLHSAIIVFFFGGCVLGLGRTFPTSRVCQHVLNWGLWLKTTAPAAGLGVSAAVKEFWD